MFAYLRASLVLVVMMTVLTGLVYPLSMTGMAQLLFPKQAAGSLIYGEDGRVIGSALIGQNFNSPAYFHGRPSAAGANGYDAMASSGSNLAPSSRALAEVVAIRLETQRHNNPMAAGPVPADLVTASASGLDPHISPAAASWQVARIAKQRQVPAAAVEALIAEHTDAPVLGVLGEKRVNVLMLNQALDRMWPMS